MSKQELINLSNSKFPTNGLRAIKAEDQRAFNDAMINEVYTEAGMIMIWPGQESTIPMGWVKCDGRVLNKVDYPDLFANIGGELSPWGVFATTFRIPNIKKWYNVIQSGDGLNVAQTGGDTTHTLSIQEMPTHNHVVKTRDRGRDQIGAHFVAGTTLVDGGECFTEEAGNGQPHNNMPPYVVMNYIIKLQ